MDVPDIYTLVFQNLKLLCLIHPDSQDVQKVLKQDMFKVPDFKAFQHVMNFILKLLIPEQWKSLIVWPVYDRKSEYQFRLAVKKALTEVNKVYSSDNLPVARAAILTNAGGKDFAAFLFRLTIFVLHKSLVEKYGLSDLLSTPLNSNNHCLETDKLDIFRTLADNTVQNFIDNSLSLANAATERDLNMKLKEIKEDIKDEEQRLFKLVQTLPKSEEIKLDLLDMSSSIGVEKWAAEVEMGITNQSETMSVLDSIGNEVSQWKQIIESSMKCAASGNCIDISSAKDMMDSESQGSFSEELPRISDVILAANKLLSEKGDEIRKNKVPDLSTVLYSLKELSAEFEELDKNVKRTYSELENKLVELKNTSDTQNGEEFDIAGVNKILESPIAPELNFYRRMSSASNLDPLFGTPKDGTKAMMKKAVCEPNFDAELLLSPRLDTSASSPVDTDIKYRSSHTQSSDEFCMPQTTSRFVAQSESKFKPKATNLSLITGTLLKSSSKANVRGKALSTICNRRAYIRIQRETDGRVSGTISKALFGKDNKSLPENSPTAFSQYGDSEDGLWDSNGDLKENALDLYSSMSLQSETISPAAIMSSTKVEEYEEAPEKKRKPRKSLEALIARYKKVISESKDIKIKNSEA